MLIQNLTKVQVKIFNKINFKLFFFSLNLKSDTTTECLNSFAYKELQRQMDKLL